MRNIVLAALMLTVSGGASWADDAADAQAFSQDEAALISSMRHVLTDVGALNARLEALRAENEKLKGSPAEKNPK